MRARGAGGLSAPVQAHRASRWPAYHRPMPTTLDGRLVVAISSRALFDFEEENRVFEGTDDRAYIQIQLEGLDTPARSAVAFSRVKKLVQFRGPGPPVEVVIVWRNAPVSGMRAFRSA